MSQLNDTAERSDRKALPDSLLKMPYKFVLNEKKARSNSIRLNMVWNASASSLALEVNFDAIQFGKLYSRVWEERDLLIQILGRFSKINTGNPEDENYNPITRLTFTFLKVPFELKSRPDDSKFT